MPDMLLFFNADFYMSFIDLTTLHFGVLNANNRNLISCSADKSIKIWDLNTSKCEHTLSGHTNSVICMKLVADGRLLSGSMDKTVRLWDLVRGNCVKIFKGHTHPVFSLQTFDRDLFASGSFKEIKVWSVDTDACVNTLKNAHDSWINCITRLTDQTFVSCSQDCTIKRWDLKTSACLQVFKGHTDEVYCMRVLLNGQLASSSRDKTVKIWSLESGACMHTLVGHGDSVWSLVVTEKGELISCSSDRSIRVWSHDQSLKLEMHGHAGPVRCLKYLGSDTLISGSNDKEIKVWDLRSGLCTQTLQGHQNDVWDLKVL